MVLSRQHLTMSIQLPARTDSPQLLELLGDWHRRLREFAVDAVVILGPDLCGGPDQRRVLGVFPPRLSDAARSLAEHYDLGTVEQEPHAPLVVWHAISQGDGLGAIPWRSDWLTHGLRSVLRIVFALPAGRAFECLLFSPLDRVERGDAASAAWSALTHWPTLRAALAKAHSPLTARELQCLALAFEGLTARASAERLACSERTVNFHLANVMAKLKVDTKMGAIQRACWLGVL
jgi:DNA-binding CsgD family transcriptional regulator